MFYQVFLSPQVKHWAIITYTHGIYEWSHGLLSRPAKMKVLLILEENSNKIEIKLFLLCAISQENQS